MTIAEWRNQIIGLRGDVQGLELNASNEGLPETQTTLSTIADLLTALLIGDELGVPPPD